MKNTDIAGIFEQMANFLEIKGENPFKIRAYRRAAQVVEHLPREIAVMLASGEDLKALPGIGQAIAAKMEELVRTGHLAAWETLKNSLPEGLSDLLEIPGIGPKTAYRLATELGISSVDELEQAIQQGKVASLFRLGDRTAENLLHQIQSLRRKDQRIPLGQALPVVEEVLSRLRLLTGAKNLLAAGSLRRFRETVGDIDLMGTAENPEAVIRSFVALPLVREVLVQGPTKASVILADGLQADLRMVEHEAFGSLLQYFTGSRQHNIALRTRMQKKGLKLSEYGITDVDTDKLEKFTTEEAFYGRLGMQYIPPEIREDRGEIDLAAKNALPELVQRSDIRGDLHVHTNWSDGAAPLESMAQAAKAAGYSYLAITDHSGGLGVAGGLNEERLLKQQQAIRRLNKELEGIRLLSGIEVNILADGRLDLSDEILSRLDVVVASVHSALNQNEAKMTRRILKALENPHVDILAHPTGRLIGKREPVAVDLEAVFQGAAAHRKVLEINCMPDRLDLQDISIYRARELGLLLAISTDAHRPEHFDLIRFGIGMARRGWCQPSSILNSRPVEEVLAHLKGGDAVR
ncbi:DNA polymerase (family 10) [Syntrophus gentianae]|uniref:DNA-directed DNA polymerase n=1 Tax=Syntrophus gentianae TaxID=43775 RepID=A0A1H7VRT3_9BACT|nr:DNA polymerase/3'-5' exonuclease PolX [Syntrophus gentianae]SEM11754.1 DNA polymerase (family 10) [Syntrophus gentianae]